MAGRNDCHDYGVVHSRADFCGSACACLADQMSDWCRMLYSELEFRTPPGHPLAAITLWNSNVYNGKAAPNVVVLLLLSNDNYIQKKELP